MAQPARVLAFAGSARAGSFNKKLIAAASHMAREAGAQVTQIDLADFPLPIYHGDLEASEGLPPNGRKLKDIFLGHDALMIASPEYNSGYSALLKNTIDWVSRPVKGEPSLACFTGKTALLLSASPGVLGGLRGLAQLRSVLSNINVLVLPEQVAIPKAETAFGPDGFPADPAVRDRLRAAVQRLSDVTARLRG
jgi:NAD(P)H-dependent FMN reductase